MNKNFEWRSPKYRMNSEQLNDAMLSITDISSPRNKKIIATFNEWQNKHGFESFGITESPLFKKNIKSKEMVTISKDEYEQLKIYHDYCMDIFEKEMWDYNI